jgi:hypothetical protein
MFVVRSGRFYDDVILSAKIFDIGALATFVNEYDEQKMSRRRKKKKVSPSRSTEKVFSVNWEFVRSFLHFGFLVS